MEKLVINSNNLENQVIKKRKSFQYESGMKHFFNTKRNEIKCAEIIHYLSILEKLQLFKLCRNFLSSVKHEIDFIVSN